MIGRLGAMFERTASVRTEEDLQHVPWQVAHTIGETLGYRAVVVNIYRPAFDDMFTAAAVGSDDWVELLLGQTTVRESWMPLSQPGSSGEAPTSSSRARSTGTGFPVALHAGDQRDDPDAWQADDRSSCRSAAPAGSSSEWCRWTSPRMGAGRATRTSTPSMPFQEPALAIRIAQDVASAAQHQRMLEHVLEVSARLAQAGDVPALLQSVCDGIRDALAFDKVVIELADEPRGTLVPVAAAGWMVDAPAVNPGMSMGSSRPLHPRV